MKDKWLNHNRHIHAVILKISICCQNKYLWTMVTFHSYLTRTTPVTLQHNKHLMKYKVWTYNRSALNMMSTDELQTKQVFIVCAAHDCKIFSRLSARSSNIQILLLFEKYCEKGNRKIKFFSYLISIHTRWANWAWGTTITLFKINKRMYDHKYITFCTGRLCFIPEGSCTNSGWLGKTRYKIKLLFSIMNLTMETRIQKFP